MCDSCEVLVINGIRCHELGCPEAWRDKTRDCAWCGREFKPVERHQLCCSDECAELYCN